MNTVKELLKIAEETIDYHVKIEESEFFLEGLRRLLYANDFKLKNKHVVVCGDPIDGLAQTLIDNGASVTMLQKNAVHKDEFLRQADLIICNGYRLNCYSIHVPVIDLQNTCINIENRDVLKENFFNIEMFGRVKF